MSLSTSVNVRRVAIGGNLLLFTPGVNYKTALFGTNPDIRSKYPVMVLYFLVTKDTITLVVQIKGDG
jgi:hypothetical protein